MLHSFATFVYGTCKALESIFPTSILLRMAIHSLNFSVTRKFTKLSVLRWLVPPITMGGWNLLMVVSWHQALTISYLDHVKLLKKWFCYCAQSCFRNLFNFIFRKVNFVTVALYFLPVSFTSQDQATTITLQHSSLCVCAVLVLALYALSVTFYLVSWVFATKPYRLLPHSLNFWFYHLSVID